MARQWTGKWAGGRTRLGRKGETVWVIEAMRDKVSYSISLDARSENEAMAELALFVRDPPAYKAAMAAIVPGDGVGDVPDLRPELLARFLEDKLSTDGDEDPITPEHARDILRSLTNWQRVLKGKDLRKLSLAELRDAARGLKPRRQHIRDFRSYTAWLRRDGRLPRALDASLDLQVPQPGEAKNARGTVGYPMEAFEKLYSAIRVRPVGQRGTANHTDEERAAAVQMQRDGHTVKAICAKYEISVATFFQWKARLANPRAVAMSPAQAVRDVLCVRALTGLHHREIERIARASHGKVQRLTGMGDIAGLVQFKHKKKGKNHSVSMPAEAVAAVERLQAAGRAPDDKTVQRLMDEACAKAGLPRMIPSELRHSFVTWAKKFGREVKPPGETGVSMELIARHVGHTTVKTTGKYDGTEIPVMIALPVRLENPEDPPLTGTPAKKVG